MTVSPTLASVLSGVNLKFPFPTLMKCVAAPVAALYVLDALGDADGLADAADAPMVPGYESMFVVELSAWGTATATELTAVMPADSRDANFMATLVRGIRFD